LKKKIDEIKNREIIISHQKRRKKKRIRINCERERSKIFHKEKKKMSYINKCERIGADRLEQKKKSTHKFAHAQ
jgi:hypothetical protein